jgi:uncharacterized RDD family membrane protein YckC
MPERLDTLVRVETPEGITLPLRCAGAIVRSHAFAIDALIRMGIVFAASLLLSWFEGLGSAVFLVLLFLLEWFYPVVFEMGRRGATPGKRAMGLRVVMDDGMPPTLAASVLRNLVRAVDFLPFAYATGVLSMLLRHDFKRLGDVVAGTRVVHDRGTTLHGTAPAAEPQAPALPLSAAQQTAVVDWALRTPRLTPARAEELAALAEPVLPPGPGTPGARLLALAHWAMGRR